MLLNKLFDLFVGDIDLFSKQIMEYLNGFLIDEF